MNLTHINPDDFKTSSGTPKLRITRSGMFTLNKHAHLLTGIGAGDKLKFSLSESSIDDTVTVYLSKDEVGFPVRGKSSGEGLNFNSTGFTNHLYDKLKLAHNLVAVSFGIDDEAEEIDGVKYYRLLTLSPLNPRRDA